MNEENKKQKAAENVYKTLIQYLDKNKLHYEASEQSFGYLVHFFFSGDDFRMEFRIIVDRERCLIRLTSPMPYRMKKENLVKAAVAVSALNYRFCDGCYSIDFSDGQILFRINASYIGSIIGEEVFDYFLRLGLMEVENWNDKFFQLDMGMIDVDAFMN